MPYVKQELRTPLEFINPMPSNAGELNYAISHLLHRYITETKKGISYANVNEAVGVVVCALLEFYLTVVLPYEREKRAENGPVTDLDQSDKVFGNGGSPTVVQPDQPGVNVDALAAALVQALGKPLPGPVPEPKARRKGKSATATTPAPVATEATSAEAPLQKGESRVLTGPIPGDTPGKEARPVFVSGKPGVWPSGTPPVQPPGKDASAAEKALYALAEGNEDEF